MKVTISDRVRRQLGKDWFHHLWLRRVHTIDNDEYLRHYLALNVDDRELNHDMAVFHCLTHDKKHPYKKIGFVLAVLALILLLVGKAHAQDVNVAKVVTACSSQSYNASDIVKLQVLQNGDLCSSGGGGGGGNPAAGLTGSPVPTFASYTGADDGSGNLIGLTATGRALDVNFKSSSITVTVSGTVTANIGTTNGLALDASLTTIDTDLKSNITLHAGANAIGSITNTGFNVNNSPTVNQGGAPWTVKPDGTAWALTGTSANVAVTNTPTVTANAGTNLNTSALALEAGNLATIVTNTTGLNSTIVTQGTTASTKILMVGGKSNDGTPQYKEIPLGASARSVIVEGFAGGTAVPVSGTVTANAGKSSSSAITSVAASVTTVVLLTSNANRVGAFFFNDSNATLYLAFAATASTSAYTVQVAPSAYFEIPLPVYTGTISGVWSVADGNVRITETS